MIPYGPPPRSGKDPSWFRVAMAAALAFAISYTIVTVVIILGSML